MANSNNLAKELREKDEAGLKEEILNIRKEQFNLRMQQGAGEMSKPHLFKNARRDIARVKTILAEKKQAGKA
ncbi:MAG: 50S ribosomal protein L29 [endosymbiont of Galathealinum brachiosum]|uniref:Large ribosomal subunit protein uL29 n=1 Tax=endosymbiont of Galathealinum brachiosum TaxID=2200906 RepID=A0A370DJF6_9GAMM|nr:MAG: 50S ribosomal protein L29 [endosymbiont of Galathealinum brachiosum]